MGKPIGNWVDFNIFIDSQNFLPLELAVENSQSFPFVEYITWKPNWLFVFGPATDGCGAYIVVLGDEQVAPVRNFDPEDENYSEKYPSLTYMMMQGAIAYQANLSGTYLRGINLSGLQLDEINLSNTNLENTNLSRTDLSRVNLSGANLKNANFYHATLFKANLEKADLTNADFTEADLEGVNFTQAIFCNTTMPDGNIRSDR